MSKENEGKTLDERIDRIYKMAKEHYITTLNSMGITPVVMPFITVWKTNSPDENITIATGSKYSYDYTIDWGDGNITNDINDSITHTYSNEGNHTVKISGEFPAIRMISSEKANFKTSQEETNAKKLQKVHNVVI